MLGGGPVTAPPGVCRTVPGLSAVSFVGTCDSGGGGGGTIKACRSSDCTGSCSSDTSFSTGKCFNSLPGFPQNSVAVKCVAGSDNGGQPGNGADGFTYAAGLGIIAGLAAAVVAMRHW